MAMEPILGDEKLDNSRELEHAAVFRSLIHNIDEILVSETQKSSQDFESFYNKIDPIFSAYDFDEDENTGDTEYFKILRVNYFLKKMLHVRNMAINTASISQPILRAVHQTDGVTDKESQLVGMSEEIKDLSSKYMSLRKEIAEKSTILTDLVEEKTLLLESNQQKVPRLKELSETTQKEDAEILDPHKIKELEKTKLRSSILAEFTQSLIVSTGLNWGDDEFLRQAVLYSGEQ